MSNKEYTIQGVDQGGGSFGGYTDQFFGGGGNCIIPSTLYNATPYDISYSGGFGGKPGVHTVKFVNADGKYDIEGLDMDLNNGLSVGITNFSREQVLTDYEIEQSVGGKILTCRFEDKRIIDLQRHLIVCRQIVKFGTFDSFLIGDQFASPCVSVYGTMYHKAPGAPNRLDADTLDLGPSPLIYTGGNADGNRGGAASHGPEYMKLSPEYVFYNSSWIANDSKLDIGDGLRSLLSNGDHSSLRFISDSGNALDIIMNLAGQCGWFLYSNGKGQLDALNQLPKIPENIAEGVGSKCSVRSVRKRASIKNTYDKGGWATWLHDDNFLAEFKARFASIDLLGLPISVCDPSDPFNEKSDEQAEVGPPNEGNNDGSDEVNVIKDSTFVSIYEPNMDEKYIAQLKRFLKMAILNKVWQNWEGMSTYIHLKRLRQNDVNGSIQMFTTQAKKSLGGKDLRTTCKRTGSLSVSSGDKGKIEENRAVDKLFPCIKPAILNYPSSQVEDAFMKSMFNDGANNNIEVKPPRGGGREILVLDAGMNLSCRNEKLGRSQPKPNGRHSLTGKVQGGKWAGGAAADRAELLSALALTVGRFWILTGPGNGGGGGGLITKRQNDYRDYHPPRGTVIWYDRRTSVRNTVFREIYELVYGDRLREWEIQGGIKREKTAEEKEEDEKKREQGKEDEIEEYYDKVYDLSVGEFLEMAYYLKYQSLRPPQNAGGDEETRQAVEERVFKGGSGMTEEQIESLNLQAQQRCARGEPKGIVIWDSGVNQPELPLQNEWMASIAEGISTKVDKTGGDVMRWTMQQATLGVIMNPMRNLKNVVEKNGRIVEAPDEPDSLDASLDNVVLNQDIEFIGQKRIKSIPFEAMRARHFWDQWHFLPGCESNAYKFQFGHKSMDGQILWRTLDCYGKVVPWRFMMDGINWQMIENVLKKEVRDMTQNELDPESSYTFTTCGESVPILPTVEQGLQSYTVTLAKDGSVITTFEVSRDAIRNGQKYNTSYSKTQSTSQSQVNTNGNYLNFIEAGDTVNVDESSFSMNLNNIQSSTKLHNGQFLF